MLKNNMKKGKKKNNNKKILDGVDVKKNINENIKEDEIINNIKDNKINDLNDKIQSIVSILFTIVIFLLILVLIFVLYNKFLKKNNIDKEKVCSEYIEKNYNINKEDIINYIIENRHIIYNIMEFDNKNIDRNTINDFSRFIIWNSDSEYTRCDNHEYCLDTKKEIEYDILKNNLIKYFNLDSLNLVFDYNFNENDATRLFIDDNKVVLTFKNMEYITLKHDIVDIRIKEKNIYIIFALSNKIDDNIYNYVGYKNLELEYNNSSFIIKNIKTNINE